MVTRCLRILALLSHARHGRSVATLADQFEVSTRTIWRDMAALQQAGFPLYTDHDASESVWKLTRPVVVFGPAPREQASEARS